MRGTPALLRTAWDCRCGHTAGHPKSVSVLGELGVRGRHGHLWSKGLRRDRELQTARREGPEGGGRSDKKQAREVLCDSDRGG